LVLRPGVIYGPGSAGLSTRIGVKLPGFFLHVGRENLLPLTYVRNCAQAIASAGKQASVEGGVQNINVVDDDLIACGEYLRRYTQSPRGLRSLPCPFFGAMLFSRAIEKYHQRSRGQLPAVLTPYKAKVL